MFRVTKRTWTCLVKIWRLLQHYNTGRNYDAANLRNYVAVTSFPFPFPRCWMFCISWLPPPENTGIPGDLERDDWHFTNLVDCFWIGEPRSVRPPDTHTVDVWLVLKIYQYFYWDLLKSQKIFSVCHELPFGHLILSIGLIVNGCCPNRESSLISASKCWTNTSPADHLLKHLEPIVCGGRASPASSGRQIRIAH